VIASLLETKRIYPSEFSGRWRIHPALAKVPFLVNSYQLQLLFPYLYQNTQNLGKDVWFRYKPYIKIRGLFHCWGRPPGLILGLMLLSTLAN
jgi:hypothetical protein